MKSIKQIWNDWVQSIKESNDQQYKNRIVELELLYKAAMIQIKSDNERMIRYKDQIWELNQKYDKAKDEIVLNIERMIKYSDKNKELSKELEYLNKEIIELKKTQVRPTTFKKANVMYEWKKGKTIKLRETLQNFSQDTEYLSKYVGFCDSLGIKKIDDIDSQIRYIYLKVQEWINAKSSDYKKDRIENWLSPQEAFDVYVTEESVGDCEDTSALIYGCIVSTLISQDRWEDNKKRLLRVDLIPTGSGGHAVLAWEKDNKTWALLESTYFEDRFSYTWKENKDIFKSVYVDIWHIFDEESEYKLE